MSKKRGVGDEKWAALVVLDWEWKEPWGWVHGDVKEEGDSPLEAACRSIVASVYGEFVDD